MGRARGKASAETRGQGQRPNKGNIMSTKCTVQLLPLAALLAMSPDELDGLANASVDMEKLSKTSAEMHKSAFPAVGKVVCAIEERLNTLVSKKLIASNTSLASYWGSITKAKLNNHALSCAVSFGAFVRTDLIAESDYDLATSQCLELAGSISNAVGGDVTHKVMPLAATQLKERGKNAAKNLRDILSMVKEGKAITPEKALEMTKALFADGHLLLVMHAATAEIAYVAPDDEKRLNEIWQVLNLGLDRAGTPAQQDQWLADAQAKTAPIEVIRAAA